MNKDSALFVGIDGGATKTVLRIEDAAGRLLGRGLGGPANIRLSVETSWRSIETALAQALQQAELDLADNLHRLYCGAGLAGTEIAAACEEFLARSPKFGRLTLQSDGYTSCLGAHAGMDGAVIAIGTGVIAFQIEGKKETRVSGWGFPHGDEGGGAWLGLEAVRRTFHWLDGRERTDPLVEAVLTRFGGDAGRLVNWAVEAHATRFAEIAPLVIEHAEKTSPLAVALMREAALNLDRIGRALAAKSEKNLPCCLLGGLGQIVEPWLEDVLRARLVPCQYDAVQGCILMARRDFACEGSNS